jgi:flagellar assembly factor FliW
VKIATKALGLIDVDERQKIAIPQGLFGFEGLKDYVLLDAEQEPFYWLQSVDTQNVAFILINPLLFRSDYEPNIGSDDLADIQLGSLDRALIFSIVTIPDEGPVTANLQGPLIINRDTKVGKQAILSDSRWTTKHDIMAEMAEGGK